jgi:hypothetical protein
MRSGLWVAALVVFAACGDSVEPDPLVEVVPEGSGLNCPNGGVAIATGLDTNGNGTLDQDEITSTSYVCSPDPLPPPPPPPAQLVTVVPEPAGAHCVFGGLAIQVGTDSNGNGVLEDAEVQTTSYLCETDASAQLVRVVIEPPGTNCEYGGQSIETGIDTNDNGILEDEEVGARSYVCTGAAGLQALVRVDPEPPGANCSGGGSAIRVGVDVDHDGSLEDTEVQTTSYLCGAPPLQTWIDGDVVIHNDLELAQLGGVTTISGDLKIDSSTLSTVDLPNLHEIGGALRCVACANLTTISLPNLNAVAKIDVRGHPPALITLPADLVPSAQPGIVALGVITNQTFPLPLVTNAQVGIDAGPNLIEVNLPELTTGEVWVGDSPNLATLSLPALMQGNVTVGTNALSLLSLPVLVTGNVTIYASPLTSLSLPALTTGDVVISAEALASISLESLVRGRIDLWGTQLTGIDLPNLTHSYLLQIGGGPLTSLALPKLEDGNVNVQQVPALTSLSLPKFGSGLVTVRGAPALSSVDLTVFHWVESLVISDSTALTSISLPALTQGRRIEISRNTALTSLSIPNLTSLSDFIEVIDNPHLPSCQVTAVFDHVQTGYYPGKVSMGNDDAATCP